MPRTSSTAVSNGNGGSPQAAAISQGTLDAYAAEGYILSSGAKDTIRLREHIFEALRTHKVLKWADREANAITRGQIIAQVFPTLAGPDQWSEAEDPQLARAIWIKVSGEVWSQLQPGAKGPVQTLVGLNMGNGYVMCRTQVGASGTDAVYITDDRTCIERDYLNPDNIALQKKIEAVSDNRAMLIMRQPANARRYAQGFDNRLKAFGGAAHDKLALAADVATANGAEPESEPGDDA